jgi:hypothetical protein
MMRYKTAMSTREMIDHELNELPEQMQREVYNFVRFLRLQADDEKFDGLVLSVSALGKDWSTPEEDAAWSSL